MSLRLFTLLPEMGKGKVIIAHPLLDEVMVAVGEIRWQRHKSRTTDQCDIRCSALEDHRVVGAGAFGKVWKVPNRPELVIYVGVYHRFMNLLSVARHLQRDPFMSWLLPLPIGLVLFPGLWVGIMPYRPSAEIHDFEILALADRFSALFNMIEHAGFRSRDPGAHNFGIVDGKIIVGYDVGSYTCHMGENASDRMMLHWLIFSHLHTYTDVCAAERLLCQRGHELLRWVKQCRWDKVLCARQSHLCEARLCANSDYR